MERRCNTLRCGILSRTTFSEWVAKRWFASADCVLPHKCAEHAMVAAASVQPVSDGRRPGAGSAGFRCVFLGSGDDSPCGTRDRDPLIHRVRWWPETEPGSHPCPAPSPETTLTGCEIGSIVVEQSVVEEPSSHTCTIGWQQCSRDRR